MSLLRLVMSGVRNVPLLDALMRHPAREVAIGDYEAAAEAEGRVADVHDVVAALIGPRRAEIAAVESRTRTAYGVRLRQHEDSL